VNTGSPHACRGPKQNGVSKTDVLYLLINKNYYEYDSFLGCDALMIKSARTSETSVYFYETTQRYIADGVISILAAVIT
jgi:hypothetical protein